MSVKEAKISLENINDAIMCIQEINTYVGKSINLREIADSYKMRNRDLFVKHLIDKSKCFNAGAGRPTIMRYKVSEEPVFVRSLLSSVKKSLQERNNAYKETHTPPTIPKSKEIVKSFECLEVPNTVNELNIISYEGITLTNAIIHLGGYEVNGTFTLKSL